MIEQGRGRRVKITWFRLKYISITNLPKRPRRNISAQKFIANPDNGTVSGLRIIPGPKN
jgi:hypothetical protein